MKLKELESNLQELESFGEAKLHLEQYITTPHLASQIVFNIDQCYDDIGGKRMCDLGCGTGMLSIASTFFEPDHILGVDIDQDALKICQRNIEHYECGELIDLVRADCKQIFEKDCCGLWRLDNMFDTVIMNPPFGTKNQKIKQEQLGIDLIFLKVAAKISSNAVYSLHKSVTRSYIKNLASKWGMDMEVVSQLRYNIPKVDNRNRRLAHEAPDKDIDVDLLRFVHK